MSFDFKKSLIKVQGGRSYLPVSARIVWFRQEHPDWGIHTEPVEINHEKQYAVFRASIYNAEGRLMATGTKKEDVKGFPDWMEKAETGSVGRALALCGFGTQFSPELDEASAGRFADSPQGGGRFSGGNYGGNNNYGSGGGNSGGGANRYGTPPQRDSGQRDSAPPQRDSAPPQRDSVPPQRESYERPAERNAPNQDSSPVRSEAPTRTEVSRPQPTRPAPAPVHDDGEDDFEALIGGSELLETNEDDPFGDELPAAPKTAAAPKTMTTAAAKADAAPSGNPACGSCGKALTKAQQELSIRNYGEAFCPTCQREKTRRPALAER